MGLVGDRFRALKYEELTPEQKTMVEHLLSGQRRGLGGPFNVLLRSPEMGDAAQQFGEQGRFHPGLSAQVAETVIILTARYWGAQFEWNAHKAAALRAGLSPAIADAIATGKRPTGMAPDVEAAYNFMDELFTTHQVSDATFQAAKDKFGEKGIVDIMATSGWYSIVSMALNVDRYPLANGAKPELKPLGNPLPLVDTAGFATAPVPGRVVAKTSMVGKTKLELRGDRFPGLSYDDMTPEQKAATGRSLTGRGAIGIFNIAVRSPQVADALWPFGDRIRFHLSVADKLKELAILITARYWMAQFEWQAHRRAGVQAGLKEETVRAVAEGRRPASLDPGEEAVYNFCTEFYKTGQVSDATFQAMKDKLGERGIVEIIGAAGYYQVVSMFMNVDRYPLADASQKPELKPLAHPLP
ncbi:MAG TPA: carboxymuconolactone decarboxylase family protein [Bryobacteraceae bacterium]|nr:carboxymuconolactone decarboxylase family protein [Bryobacteraceae bacterium]